jgi:hypothetical protein
MSSSFNDSKKFISDFNEGALQIMRLNYLWQQCNNYASQGLMEEWKWKLDRIWIELSADAYKKDKIYYSLKLKLINKKIQKAKDKDELYVYLQKKEIFLKQLQDEVGKGSKRSQTFENIM